MSMEEENKCMEIPKPIGYLELSEAQLHIAVFKHICWFHRLMIRWCFGFKFIKAE